MRDRHPAHRGVPGNRASTEGLPAKGESAKHPAAQRKAANREEPGRQATPWHQTDRDSANADRRDGQSSKSEQNSERKIARGNPRFYRGPLHSRSSKRMWTSGNPSNSRRVRYSQYGFARAVRVSTS